MSFSKTIFLFAFLPFTLAGYYLIKTDFRNVFLVIMSLLFYACGEPKFVFVLCTSIIVNYLIALLIERYRAKKAVSCFFMILSLIGNVGLLFVYKYLATTVGGINSIFGTHLSFVSLTLPLGISFFTFRAISYVLDVYFQTSKAQKNVLNVALYISFFPQLTMGPISKYSDFEKQLNRRTISSEKFAVGCKRFIIGLAKKVILSNSIGIMVDKVFALSASGRSVSLSWLGIIGYCLQLYYDFAGYSDMAIGLSNMFGFDCPENFDYPYLSKSVGEFWRRWHITLGNWLKDYLYVPVFRGTMMKKNPVTHKAFTINQCDIIALFVTWIVCGMWHGAGVKFLFYGMYYFIFIACERMLQAHKKKIAKQKKLPKHKETRWEAARAHVYAVIVILFGQLIFRAPSLSAAVSYAGSMFGLQGNAFTNAVTSYYFEGNAVILVLALIFCFPIAKYVKKLCDTYVIPNRFAKVTTPLLYIALFITGISYAINSTYNAFIYFKF